MPNSKVKKNMGNGSSDYTEMTDVELLTNTILAYVDYIDCHNGMDEQERSNLLMNARTLDIEVKARKLYGN